MKKTIEVLVLIFASLLICSAYSCFSWTYFTNWFRVKTQLIEDGIGPFGFVTDVSATELWAEYWATGTYRSFSPTTTDLAGNVVFNDARLPGQWRISITSGTCGGVFFESYIQSGETHTAQCIVTHQGATISPSSASPDNVASQFTFTGTGFSTQYGMPRVAFYDPNGNAVAYSDANSVSLDGTIITAPSPSYNNLYSGDYIAIAFNKNSNGLWDYVAQSTITLSGFDPPDYIYEEGVYGGDTTSDCTGGRINPDCT